LSLTSKSFLTEHKDKDAVSQGWNEVMQHIAEAGNVLVVLKGLNVIAPRMFPVPHNSQQGQGVAAGLPEISSQNLASLVALSLKNKKFRCLMVLDEQENNRLKGEFTQLFTTIKAPELTTAEQLALCVRLYGAPELGQPLPSKDIQSLFKRMRCVLDVVPFAPSAIMLAVKDAQQTWERSWRYKADQKERLQKLEAAESHLQEAQRLKEQLLEKLWGQRRAGQEEPLPVMQAALMLEKILIPLYSQAIVILKVDLPSAEQVLVDAVQERFQKFFGPCTGVEEKRLLDLPRLLKEQIIGQDPAIEAIGKALYSWRKVPPRDGKPLVLFVAGPSAAGKTETATALAYHLNHVYGIAKSADKIQEKNFLKIPLNREKLGGIWGWNLLKTSILEFIQKNPTGVVAFEEWDKMSNSERSCLLELFDGSKSHMEGEYTRESERPFVESRCVTFLVLANTAGDLLANPAEGDPNATFTQDIQTVREKIVESYGEKVNDAAAFLSRIDAVIPFRGISAVAGSKLIDNYLAEYVEDGVLPARYLDAVRKKISSHKDGRELQRLVREAIMTGVPIREN
jgi:ATP-dependent Clp protease ATP-binding subunit ClpA